jgi:hypothetical protein
MDASKEETRIRLDQVDDVLVAFWDWLRIQEVRWRDDPERKEYHISPSIAAGDPMLELNGRAAAIRRRSFARRVTRTFAFGLVAIAMIGGAYGWEYGDDSTKEALKGVVDTLTTLPSVLVPAPDNAAGNSRGVGSELAAVQDASGLQATAGKPSPSAELQQRLETMSADIAAVQRTVEKLAARQELMTQDVVALQSAQKSVAQKLSALTPPVPSTPPPHRNAPAATHAAVPPAPPAAPATPAPPASTTRAPLPIH